MDLFRKLEGAARKVGDGAAVRLGVKQRYHAVDNEVEEPAAGGMFTIEDDDGGELNLDQLSRMHSQLLDQAQNSINSAETQVMSLRAERAEHERAVRELTLANDEARDVAPSVLDDVGSRGAQSSCRCRRLCVIL